MARFGFCAKLVMLCLLIATTVAFFIMGALGPKSAAGIPHNVKLCVVENARNLISEHRFIDQDSCKIIGQLNNLEDLQKPEAYAKTNAMFYTSIPFLSKQVLSRLFHFLVVDIGISFRRTEISKKIMESGQNYIQIEVSLGYRDDLKGEWNELATGNVTRMLTCRPNTKGSVTCDHPHLFELGSCHHKQYIVNLYFPQLPLEKQYKGISAISSVNLYVIHQTMAFTRVWFVLKSILCPLTAIVLVWFKYRLSNSPTSPSLQNRLLSVLGYSLVFYNTPFDLLSLYFNFPWLLVFNDFRQGLFIACLFTFWIISIQEHRQKDDEAASITKYWKELGIVFLACTFLFVYEFCERGIQALYPFYSLWSNKLSIAIAYSFIGIAMFSALLYLVVFLVATVRAYRELKNKEKELATLSQNARRKYEGLFGQFKFFLFVTVLVCVGSIATVVLPTELMLHSWQQGKAEYAVYSGLLTGNYGMWNVYTVLVMILLAPSRHTAGASEEGDQTNLQKFLSKQSQN